MTVIPDVVKCYSGLAGLTRGGATRGMAMATDGTTTGATWDTMATMATTIATMLHRPGKGRAAVAVTMGFA